jgi:hypothetical protein
MLGPNVSQAAASIERRSNCKVGLPDNMQLVIPKAMAYAQPWFLMKFVITGISVQ